MSHHTSHGNTTSDARGGNTTSKLTFWHKYEHRHLDKLLYRSIHLRLNKDYQIRYPNECKNVKTGEIHPEAKLRIMKEHSHQLERAQTPSVIRPERMNRIG